MEIGAPEAATRGTEDGSSMDEGDFWKRLEFRICAEFQGFGDRGLRGNWCDGLVAEEYDLTPPQPCIRGLAYCGHSGQEPWRFTLIVDPRTRSRADIDWSALVPGDRSTGWLSPDPRLRTMTIDPLDGYPD